MYQKQIILKNAQPILLRPISLKDIQERHQFFIALSLAQTGMVHTVDEIEFHTHETEDRIKDFLNNKRGLWAVALNQHNNIVGEIDITVKNLARVKHNGLLTIGVLPEYQSIGLGSALMDLAFDWAIKHKLLRIELSVFASNQKAKKLYQKFGFVTEGIRKNYLRHDDNAFEDDVIIAKYFFNS